MDHPELATPGDTAPRLLSRNAEAVAQLHAHEERAAGPHQRAIEALVAALGRPGVLYAIVVAVLAWGLGNVAAVRLGAVPLDPPPFVYLQGVLGLSSVLLTTTVLIAQGRLGRLAERRAQLDLQVNLLAEQKIAKLVALLEELRRDLPNVRNRPDAEAAAMQAAADPGVVLSVLERTIAAANERAADATPTSPLARVRVLVVESDAAAGARTAATLTTHGAEVTAVASAAAARAALHASDFDVLVLDRVLQSVGDDARRDGARGVPRLAWVASGGEDGGWRANDALDEEHLARAASPEALVAAVVRLAAAPRARPRN